MPASPACAGPLPGAVVRRQADRPVRQRLGPRGLRRPDQAGGPRSAGFGANEVVTGLADIGHPLDIQACHVSGPATTVGLTIESVALTAASPALTRLHDQDRASARSLPRAARPAHRCPTAARLPPLRRHPGRPQEARRRPPGASSSRSRCREDLPGPRHDRRRDHRRRQPPPTTRSRSSFLMGVHHAREWPSAEIPMEFATLPGPDFGTDAARHRAAQARARRDRAGASTSTATSRRARPRPTSPTPAATRGGAPALGRGRGAPGGTLAYRRKNCDGAIARARRPPASSSSASTRTATTATTGAAPAPARRRRPELPRHRPVVGARDPGRPRVLADPRRHVADHDAQLRVARAAPARAARRRPGARRGRAQGARRRDGRRHRLHVAVRLPALRHLGHDRGLELRRRRHVRLHDRDGPRGGSGGNFHVGYSRA